MVRITTVLASLSLAAILGGCSSLPFGGSASGRMPEAVDVAIVTILEEEYDAVLKRLERVEPLGPDEINPDLAEAVEAELARADGKVYRILLARSQDKGQVAGALATQEVAARWRPNGLLLVGIAGGMVKEVKLGDVVLATSIWGYELGRLGSDFVPQGELFAPDEALLRAAREIDADWRDGIRVEAPEGGAGPVLRAGVVASGNKVVETSGSDFFAALVKGNPAVIAVEMEGAGAAEAIELENKGGARIEFLMIRGISDVVQSGSHELTAGAQNPQRDLWKAYAADAAATVAVELIRSAWPIPPR